jgi:multimeric flavodoxin WrbA
MKALAINGSPRKGGNTESMLKAVLEPIAAAGMETELIQIGGKPYRGCLACGMCAKNQDQKCVIDDGLNDVLAKMWEADAIIIGSPTYFADVTAETKALLDRAGYVSFSGGRLLSRKIGSAVSVHRRGGAVQTHDTINHMFQINRMILPGSLYWNFGVGMNKGDALEDAEALANMADLGETIAFLCEKTRS